MRRDAQNATSAYLSKHLLLSLAWEQCCVAINKSSDVGHAAESTSWHRSGCSTREHDNERAKQNWQKQTYILHRRWGVTALVTFCQTHTVAHFTWLQDALQSQTTHDRYVRLKAPLSLVVFHSPSIGILSISILTGAPPDNEVHIHTHGTLDKSNNNNVTYCIW